MQRERFQSRGIGRGRNNSRQRKAKIQTGSGMERSKVCKIRRHKMLGGSENANRTLEEEFCSFEGEEKAMSIEYKILAILLMGSAVAAAITWAVARIFNGEE